MEYYDSINKLNLYQYYSTKNNKVLTDPDVINVLDQINNKASSNAINLFEENLYKIVLHNEEELINKHSSKSFSFKHDFHKENKSCSSSSTEHSSYNEFIRFSSPFVNRTINNVISCLLTLEKLL